MSDQSVYSVSEITKQIKGVLEETFDDVQIMGEISNFKAHYSGHWYFSLKDADAQISCVLWRSFTNYVFFTPQDGMKVVLRGKLTLYAPRGSYQIDVRSMQPAGAGELQIAFDALKQKLAAEGLFEAEYKKDIPKMPLHIGIATAIDGAALQDMLSVARRRFPLVELHIVPCRVQGAGAAESVVKAIQVLNAQDDIEVIILARGGGSIEDLWAFNEEITARAIFGSDKPIITGVGHEVDFTIADFVADMRAPTPTAAMEYVTPDQDILAEYLEGYSLELRDNLRKKILLLKNRVEFLHSSGIGNRPVQLLQFKTQSLDYAVYRLERNIRNQISDMKHKVELLRLQIKKHDTGNALKKGFVLVKQHGKFVKRGADLLPQSGFVLDFFDTSITIDTNEKTKRT
ncbi:MAG: exodeoxyribonuclease VII large subunit [Ignavibacteria bacterium]|nr:exodeoxyribonuclease VII large subunit [Ignavibacteria bacterium]